MVRVSLLSTDTFLHTYLQGQQHGLQVLGVIKLHVLQQALKQKSNRIFLLQAKQDKHQELPWWDFQPLYTHILYVYLLLPV